MSSSRLDSQTALVTGASTGIGAACAVAFARAGADVAINYRASEREAQTTKKQCEREGVEAELFQADVSDPVQTQAMFARVLEVFGRLDILVANAGMQIDKPFVDLTVQDWQTVLAVNLSGQFYSAQQAARIFIGQGVTPEFSKAAGKIIHMSSVHDRIPWPGHCNYAASKGGIKMLMTSTALELAKYKIRVNALAPGAIRTAINQQVWRDDRERDKLLEIIPYQRLGEPDEVAKAAVWLASDDADYITGTTLYIDGGMTLYPSFIDNG